MSDYIKQKEDEKAIEENFNEKEIISEDVEKKKKPFLERLGIIEAVNNPRNRANIMDENADHIYQKERNGNDEIKKEQYNSESNIEKLSISNIYAKFGINDLETSSIYLLESFIKALPDNLPAYVKRQSIINLVSASQLELSKLLKDGEKRIQVLETYQQDFTKEVNDLIATTERIIQKLNERIANHKKIIEEKQNLLADQKADVEFEMQKINNIINLLKING